MVLMENAVAWIYNVTTRRRGYQLRRAMSPSSWMESGRCRDALDWPVLRLEADSEWGRTKYSLGHARRALVCGRANG
jgi:hypothetical protein